MEEQGLKRYVVAYQFKPHPMWVDTDNNVRVGLEAAFELLDELARQMPGAEFFVFGTDLLPQVRPQQTVLRNHVSERTQTEGTPLSHLPPYARSRRVVAMDRHALRADYDGAAGEAATRT